MLDKTEIVLPYGGNMWDDVERQYNTGLPIFMAPRTADSCKTKFNKLKSIRKPTGDPSCPPEVRRAKNIQRAIENSMGVANFDSDHDEVVPEGEHPAAASSVVDRGGAADAEVDSDSDTDPQEPVLLAGARASASAILAAPTFQIPPSEETLSALTQALESYHDTSSSSSSSNATTGRPPLPPSRAASPHRAPEANGSASRRVAGPATPAAAPQAATRAAPATGGGAAAVSRPAAVHRMGPPSSAAVQPLLAGSGRTGLTHQQLVDIGRRVDTPRSEVTSRRHRYDDDIHALTASLNRGDDGLHHLIAQTRRDELRREQVERDRAERDAERDERRYREQREREERREQRDMQYNQSLLLFIARMTSPLGAAGQLSAGGGLFPSGAQLGEQQLLVGHVPAAVAAGAGLAGGAVAEAGGGLTFAAVPSERAHSSGAGAGAVAGAVAAAVGGAVAGAGAGAGSGAVAGAGADAEADSGTSAGIYAGAAAGGGSSTGISVFEDSAFDALFEQGDDMFA